MFIQRCYVVKSVQFDMKHEQLCVIFMRLENMCERGIWVRETETDRYRDGEMWQTY